MTFLMWKRPTAGRAKKGLCHMVRFLIILACGSDDLDSNPSVCVHRGPDANFPIQKHKMSKWHLLFRVMGFPGGSVSKESACNVGGPGLLPGSGRSRGEGNGSPLQCSCLGGPMDRGAWGATVHGIAKSRTGGLNAGTFFSTP